MVNEKIFFEIRYGVQVDVFDNMGKIMKTFWPDEYKHWNKIEDTINFGDEEKVNDSLELFSISPKRILFRVENSKSHQYFPNKLYSLLDKTKHWIKPSYISRVGIRRYAYNEEIIFKDFLQKTISGSIFNIDFLTKIKIDDKIDDFAITFEGDDYRLVFGPMKKDEQHQYLKEISDKNNLKESFLFVDYDCFEKNADYSKLNFTINKLYQKVCTMSDLVSKTLGDD